MTTHKEAAHVDSLREYQKAADALAEIQHSAERGWCDPEEAAAARVEHERAWSSFISTMEDSLKLSNLRATRDAANADLERVSRDPTATESEIRKARKIASTAHNEWLDAATDQLTGGAYAQAAE